MATPPESPQGIITRDTSLHYEGAIIPELDIYAIPCSDGKYIEMTISRLVGHH